MSMEPKEPPFRPIPFAPGYGVSRDGRLARLKPYRVLQVLSFHDVLREASKDKQYRTLARAPHLPPRPMILFDFRADASEGARAKWWHSTASHATRLLSLHGDVKQGWVSLRLPLSDDGKEFVRMMLHGASVAAFVYGDT
jgi:hypothetical protein